MLLFSQQYEMITKIYYSFNNGYKVDSVKFTEEEFKRAKCFLNPIKYENQTKKNFGVLILWTMLNKKPKSKIELLKTLNSYTKDDINNAFKLLSDLKAYKYIIEKDKLTLEKVTISPYEAWKKKMISTFTLSNYYSENPLLVKGRIMTKHINDANVFMQYFNLSGEKVDNKP